MLTLASRSPRRRELLELAGVEFRTRPVEIGEQPLVGEEPAAFAGRMAGVKARAAARAEPGWVLGADTVVALGGEIFGKPADTPEAARMLRSLSGRTHQVYTAVELMDSASGRSEKIVERTEVSFRQLDDDILRWYIESREPMDKAGAYAIQGKGTLLVRSISGSYTNVVGLPLCETLELLSRFGLWRGPGAPAGGEK